MTRTRIPHGERFGCFVAAVATILGQPFHAAKKALGFRPEQFTGEDPSAALSRLRLVGITPKRRTWRRQQRRMLLLIRWRDQPDLMHAVVWTGRRIVEPERVLLDMPLREYESQLEAAYEV